MFIKDTSVVPWNGWIYHVDATNTDIKTFNYNVLYSMIRDHCVANGAVIPTEQEVIIQLCTNLSIPCYDGESPLVNKFSLGIPKPPSVGCCGRVGIV